MATLRERIILLLRWPPYNHGATASQLCAHMNSLSLESAKLASVSSQLCKMSDAGELVRLPGFGPRGGNGYTLATVVWRCGDCGHVMPDTYDSDCDKCHSSNISIINGDT